MRPQPWGACWTIRRFGPIRQVRATVFVTSPAGHHKVSHWLRTSQASQRTAWVIGQRGATRLVTRLVRKVRDER